jgi:hypothetical protein
MLWSAAALAQDLSDVCESPGVANSIQLDGAKKSRRRIPAMTHISGSPAPQQSLADYGISAEQVEQLHAFFQDTVVTYKDDAGKTITKSAVALLDEPSLDPDQALALLQAISAKLRGENSQSATEAISANKEKQEILHEERMEKLLESLKSVADAKKSGQIGQVFAWIGVALAMIAAAAMAVLTFGAGAGASALMVAGCIAAVTGAVLATTTQIVTQIPGAMESMGDEGRKAFMYTMMALQVAAAVVALGAGIGTAVQAAKATADIAVEATKMMKYATVVSNSAQMAGGASEVATGAAGISRAEQQHNADLMRADMQEIAKFLKQLQQSDEKEIEFIKTLQEMTDKAWQIVAGASKDMMDARTAVVQFSPA